LDQIAYVNGSFVPLADAKVSILDRGFLFADGIYEVAAVLDGMLIDNASHLARLERSVGEISLALPETTDRIQEIQKELIVRNNLVNGMVYLEVTRGADTGRDFAFPKGVKPTLILFTSEKDIVNAPSAKTGIGVISVPDLRWTRRDIKSVALLAQVLAKQAAAEAGRRAGDAAEWQRDSAGLHAQGGGGPRRGASAPRRGTGILGRRGAGGEGSFYYQRYRVRAGGGQHRRQDGCQWQARPDDGSLARNLRGFRQSHRTVKFARLPRNCARSGIVRGHCPGELGSPGRAGVPRFASSPDEPLEISKAARRQLSNRLSTQ
jgi:hypothetical protein